MADQVYRPPQLTLLCALQVTQNTIETQSRCQYGESHTLYLCAIGFLDFLLSQVIEGVANVGFYRF